MPVQLKVMPCTTVLSPAPSCYLRSPRLSTRLCIREWGVWAFSFPLPQRACFCPRLAVVANLISTGGQLFHLP